MWSGKWHWEGDTKTPDGAIVEKWKLVDISTLNWSLSSPTHTTDRVYVVTLSDKLAGFDNLRIGYKYSWTNASTSAIHDDGYNMTYRSHNTNGNIYIRNDSCNDVAAFKTAMSGVYIMYELDTPTTSQGTAYEENEQCHNWGIQWTEDAEYEAGNRPFRMPMGGEEVYTPDLTSKLEAAPATPTTDGYYILKVTNGQAEFVSYTP